MIKYLLLIITVLPFFGVATAQEFELNTRERHNEVAQKVTALHDKAHAFFTSEDSIKVAIDLLHKAYAISDAANYTTGIIKSTEELGRGYLSLSDNAQATRYFYISLKKAESVQDSLSVSQAYIGLGLVMYGMQKWSEAISYFTHSIKFNYKSE